MTCGTLLSHPQGSSTGGWVHFRGLISRAQHPCGVFRAGVRPSELEGGDCLCQRGTLTAHGSEWAEWRRIPLGILRGLYRVVAGCIGSWTSARSALQVLLTRGL